MDARGISREQKSPVLMAEILLLLLAVGGVCSGRIQADDASSGISAIPDSSVPQLTFFQAAVLGVVEGATEYLPVSSTGHLLIAEHLLGMDGDEQQRAAAQSLAICIQCGAILAVFVLYLGRIRQILRGLTANDVQGRRLLVNLIVAFFPAAVLGLLLNKWIKAHLFGVMPVALGLLAGGVIIVLQAFRRSVPDPLKEKRLTDMEWREALLVGLLQCLAFWPGFSRSLATILGCRWVRLRMLDAVEFSFLLGLVTLSAATAYEGLKHGRELFETYGVAMPCVSLVIAFTAAVVSVRFMVTALSRFGLLPFGIYRIGLAILCAALLNSGP